MSQAEQGKFTCESCGKAYAWKRELAGRKVRCTCGQVLPVPAHPAQPAHPGQHQAQPRSAASPAKASPAAGPPMPPAAQKARPAAADAKAAQSAPAAHRSSPARAQAAPAAKPKSPPAKAKAPPARQQVVSDGDDLGELYELAGDEAHAAESGRVVADDGLHCPSCQSELAPGAVICVSCGYNLKTGARVSTATVAASAPKIAAALPAGAPLAGVGAVAGAAMAGAAVAGSPASAAFGFPRPISRGEEQDNELGGDMFREIILPVALCLLGMAMLTAQHMYGDYSIEALGLALPRVAVSLIFNLVLSFGGMLLVARLFEIGFGAPGPAVLKAAACCLMPPALANLVGSLVGSDSFFVQVMISSIIMVPLTWGAFMFLFYLEFDEAVYLSIVIWLVNQWLIIFLVGAIFGSGGMGMAGGFGLGPSQQTLTTADQDAVALLGSPQNKGDPMAWLMEDQNAILGQMFRQDSLKLAGETLQLAGAGNVNVIARGSIGSQLVMVLPKDEEKRAKIFKWEAQRAALYGYEAEEDHGQKYLIVEPYFLDPSAPPPAPRSPDSADDDAAADEDDEDVLEDE